MQRNAASRSAKIIRDRERRKKKRLLHMSVKIQGKGVKLEGGVVVLMVPLAEPAGAVIYGELDVGFPVYAG